MNLLTMLLSATISAFMMMKHPLSLVLTLILLTTLILLFMLSLGNSSWLSMILFLVFLGGLLIIFTYLSALVPNEVNFLNIVWLMVLLSPLITYNYFESNYSQVQKKNLIEMINLNEMSAIYTFLLYLLVTLLTTMVMSQFLKSPLNQNNY